MGPTRGSREGAGPGGDPHGASSGGGSRPAGAQALSLGCTPEDHQDEVVKQELGSPAAGVRALRGRRELGLGGGRGLPQGRQGRPVTVSIEPPARLRDTLVIGVLG